jgi:hypothetical protein
MDGEVAAVEMVVLEERQLGSRHGGGDESEGYHKYGDLHRVSFQLRLDCTLSTESTKMRIKALQAI